MSDLPKQLSVSSFRFMTSSSLLLCCSWSWPVLEWVMQFIDQIYTYAMTKGAEPIYLHLIRPFLKPYTPAIDQVLDFAQLVGDIVFGLAVFPFVYILRWWNSKFGTVSKCSDVETDTSSCPISSTSGIKTQPPTSHAYSSKPMKATEGLVSKSRQPASGLPPGQEKAPVSSTTSCV